MTGSYLFNYDSHHNGLMTDLCLTQKELFKERQQSNSELCYPLLNCQDFLFFSIFSQRIMLKPIFKYRVSFLKTRSKSSLIPIRIIRLHPYLHSFLPTSLRFSACLRTFPCDIPQISCVVDTISSEKIRKNSDVFEISSEKI